MIAKDALAQANLLPFSPSLKSGLLRRQRLSLAAQSAQPAPAGACGAACEFFKFFPATISTLDLHVESPIARVCRHVARYHVALHL